MDGGVGRLVFSGGEFQAAKQMRFTEDELLTTFGGDAPDRIMREVVRGFSRTQFLEEGRGFSEPTIGDVKLPQN